MNEDCIFCGIASGKDVADIVRQNEELVAFRDISPKAPVHVVVIPKKHIESLDRVAAGDAAMLGNLIVEISELARELDLEEGGYRVVTNIGADAGQQVKHLHWHILGGENLGPLRC